MRRRSRLFGTIILCAAALSSLALRDIRAQNPADSQPPAATKPASAGQADEPFPTGKTIFRQSKLEEQIRTALDRKWDGTNYDKTQLRDVVNHIELTYKISVDLDLESLDKEGRNPETEVTAKIPADTTLRRALRMALSPLQLAYVVSDDRLVITTASLTYSEAYTSARVYQVHDLVDPGRVSDSFNTLMDHITGAIQPDSWRNSGGTLGDIRSVYADGLMALIITQTESGHEQIEELLTNLRNARDAKVREIQRKNPRARDSGNSYADTLEALASARLAGVDLPQRPQVSADLVTASNRLGFDLYRKHVQDRDAHDNLVLSPIGTVSALGPIYAGSSGATAAQFGKVLGIAKQDDFNFCAFELTRWFNDPTPLRGYKLRSRTHLLVQPDLRLTPRFVDTARRYFDVTPMPMDFKAVGPNAQDSLQRLIENDSDGFLRIDDLLQYLTSTTRLAVVNTIFFQGRWEKPFSELQTTSQPFHASDGPTRAKMMHLTEDLGYAETDDVQIVRKPYQGAVEAGPMALYLMLPRKPEQFAKMEAELKPELLEKLLAEMSRQRVDLTLPRFKFDNLLLQTGPLQQLGLTTAFTEQADLSGIDGERKLRIENVIQKAKIEVNETETKAAATTIVTGSFGGSGAAPELPIIFRCDRPFVFFIRDDTTGTILFLGRLVDPRLLD